MKRFLYITLLIFIASCSKEEFIINNLNGNRIDVLGHAGSGISNTYPINSYESIINSFTLGADGTELDLQLTKDSVLVAFHDDDLSASTNLEGKIRDLTWAEISEGQYDVTTFTSYKILRIEDLLGTLSNSSDYIFTFDIKLNPGANETFESYIESYTNALVNLYNNYDLHDHSFLEAQSVDFIELLQAKDLNIKQFIYPQHYSFGLSIAQNYNLYGITISNQNITADQVLEAHELGFRITIWGVQSKNENIDAIKKNPDMIQTDNIENLLDLLN